MAGIETDPVLVDVAAVVHWEEMADIDTVQALAARMVGVPAPMWQTEVGWMRDGFGAWVDVGRDAPSFLQTFAGKVWLFTRDDTARAGWRCEPNAPAGQAH